MSNSLQDFIQQLKKIDVADLLEKAKTVKIDDIKKIKFSDILQIRKNKFFYPITGLFLASLITGIFTIPAYRSMISTIEKSKKYSFQSDNFELLEEKLNRGKNTLSKFNENFNLVSDMVIESEYLIYLTRIIDESAKRSLIKISQFRPINPQELLDLIVTTVYMLLPDQISKDLEISLDKGEIWKFSFNFRSDYRMETGFILKNDNGYFAIIGIPNHINLLSHNAPLPEEEDADEDDDLDFEMF